MPKPDLDNADSLNSVDDARRKGVYRDPIVGPDALDKMLRPAAPGWPEYRSAPA